MKKFYSATAAALLLAVLVIAPIAHSSTPIQIGQTSSNITAEAGCNFWRPGADGEKLVNVQYNGVDLIEYKHESGKPILLVGQQGADKNYNGIAALNINGKEVLLEMTKAESIQCLDKNHNKQVYCESQEYANETIQPCYFTASQAV